MKCFTALHVICHLQHERITAAEEVSIRRLKAREAHLAHCTKEAGNSAVKWAELRMPRLITDYLLRQGWFDAAEMLSEETGCGDLCDWDVFNSAKGIIEALTQHDCAPALDWCVSNHIFTMYPSAMYYHRSCTRLASTASKYLGDRSSCTHHKHRSERPFSFR